MRLKQLQFRNKKPSRRTNHFFKTSLSHFVPVCAAINFFRSLMVSSGLEKWNIKEQKHIELRDILSIIPCKWSLFAFNVNRFNSAIFCKISVPSTVRSFYFLTNQCWLKMKLIYCQLVTNTMNYSYNHWFLIRTPWTHFLAVVDCWDLSLIIIIAVKWYISCLNDCSSLKKGLISPKLKSCSTSSSSQMEGGLQCAPTRIDTLLLYVTYHSNILCFTYHT